MVPVELIVFMKYQSEYETVSKVIAVSAIFDHPNTAGR